MTEPAAEGTARTRVASTDDVAPGGALYVEVGAHRLCLARTEDGELFAIDDTCTHEDESLSEGWLEGNCIECPAHNSIFDLRTGEAVTLPATEPVATYPVTVDGDDVYVVLEG